MPGRVRMEIPICSATWRMLRMRGLGRCGPPAHAAGELVRQPKDIMRREMRSRVRRDERARSNIEQEKPVASSSDTGKFRIEEDALGDVQVPAEHLWGAQTERSRQNFPIGVERYRWGRPVIRALGILKKCSALANA